jgi:sugar phosphate permease
LAQGFVGTLSGVGASISTTFFGLIFGDFGSTIGFLSIASVALVAVLLAWLAMPETKPLAEKSEQPQPA